MILESTKAQIKHGSPNIANAVLYAVFFFDYQHFTNYLKIF